MFDSPPNTPSITPLQQHASFAAALRACGQNPQWLVGDTPLLALGRRRAGLPITLLSRAHIDDPHQLGMRLKQAGLARNIILISPEHATPALADIGAVPLMTPGHMARVDLTLPPAVRRAALHQKWRNRLVFSEAQGLRICRQNMPLKPDHWLLAADARQQASRGYRHWPAALTLTYAQENPGAAKLFTAFEGRDPVAAMLFLRHGTGATYHIGHTNARGRALCAHNLLLWQAMAWLATRGHRALELGLIDTAKAAGLARFKLGAGAKAHRLGGTWGWWPPAGRLFKPFAALDRRHM